METVIFTHVGRRGVERAVSRIGGGGGVNIRQGVGCPLSIAYSQQYRHNLHPPLKGRGGGECSKRWANYSVQNVHAGLPRHL
jgi:hypothetical protein